MADSRRVIVMYADVENSKIKSEDNADLRDNMVFFRGSQLLIQCHLRLSDGSTYMKPPAGAQWFFGIDNSYIAGHADLVVSAADQFNISEDWTSLNAENGKICFRVNTATTQLTTAVGTSASIDTTGELWYTVPGSYPVLVCQWPITVKNIVCEIETDTELVYTTSGLLTIEGNDIVLFFPDGSVANRWTKE